MVKGRFTVNPFPELKLSSSDTGNLHEVAGAILEANVQRYENFLTKEHKKIDPNKWKVLKTKENSTVYTARHHDVYRTGTPTHNGHNSTPGLPSLLSLGTTHFPSQVRWTVVKKLPLHVIAIADKTFDDGSYA
ncbi:hypothetical protein PRIC2_014082 [Phytophthora ramorum]